MTFARFHRQHEHDGNPSMRNLRDLRSEQPHVGDGCLTHAVSPEDVAATRK